jgi:polar amino acid transport system substrate-binding protein
MTRSRPLLPCLAVLALAALCLTGICRAEKLIVGVEDIDFYPYGKTTAEAGYVGYLRDLLDAFAAAQGYAPEYAVTPIKRLYLRLGDGDLDFFVPDNPAWSQEKKKDIEIYYSGPVAVARDGFAVLPGREQESIGTDIVHLGIFLGFTVEPLFQEAELSQIVFNEASRFESLFRTLFLGRIDAVYCNQAAAYQVLKELGKPVDAISWSHRLPRFRSEFHVSSTRRELVEQLDDWMRKNPDRVRDLKREYGILDGETTPWGE